MKLVKLSTDVGKIGDLKLPRTSDGSPILSVSHVDDNGNGNFEIPENAQECLERSHDEQSLVDTFITGLRLYFNKLERLAMIYKFRENGGLQKVMGGAKADEVKAEAEEAAAYALDVASNALAGSPVPEEFGGSTTKSPFEKAVALCIQGNPGLSREDAIERVKAVAATMGIEVPVGV